MIVTLAILIFCLGVGSGEEGGNRWKESSYLHPMWETKCRLTRVEQHIHDYKRNGSLLYLPRLRDLRPRLRLFFFFGFLFFCSFGVLLAFSGFSSSHGFGANVELCRVV